MLRNHTAMKQDSQECKAAATFECVYLASLIFVKLSIGFALLRITTHRSIRLYGGNSVHVSASLGDLDRHGKMCAAQRAQMCSDLFDGLGLHY